MRKPTGIPLRTDVTVGWHNDNDTGTFPLNNASAEFLDNVMRMATLLDDYHMKYIVWEEDGLGTLFASKYVEGVYLNTYLCTRAYGGPEEGGWWYDKEVLADSEDVSDLSYNEQVQKLHARRAVFEDETVERDFYSVNANGLHVVRLEPHPGKDIPLKVPRYE